jgi:hypothetical protein
MGLKGRQLVTRRNCQMEGYIAEQVGVDGETAPKYLVIATRVSIQEWTVGLERTSFSVSNILGNASLLQPFGTW